MLRLPALIAIAVLTSACASYGDRAGERDPLRAALERQDCHAAHGKLEARSPAQDRLEVAAVCLQRGEFERTRELTAGVLERSPSEAEAEQAAYLHALARAEEWTRTRAMPLDRRIDNGREVFLELAGYLETHAGSRYAESLAPRLARVREDLATLELRQADAAGDRGDKTEATARTEYVRDYYPGTAASREAADRLQDDAAY